MGFHTDQDPLLKLSFGDALETARARLRLDCVSPRTWLLSFFATAQNRIEGGNS
jgi:hypothetical protein